MVEGSILVHIVVQGSILVHIVVQGSILALCHRLMLSQLEAIPRLPVHESWRHRGLGLRTRSYQIHIVVQGSVTSVLVQIMVQDSILVLYHHLMLSELEAVSRLPVHET